MLERENSFAGRTLTSSSPLSSLKPRQVLLNMKSKDNQTSSSPSDSEMDKKKIVLHSIYQFLQRNELPKAARKLLSQAKLDLNEPLNGYKIDFEEVCFKHLELLQLDRISKRTEDKKGGKSKSVANNVGNGQSEAVPEEKCKDTTSDGTGKEQPKEKKKSKSTTDSEITEEDTIEIAPEGKGTKSKHKKKKRISQNGDMEELEKENLVAKSTQGDQLAVNNAGNGQLEALLEDKCDDTKSDATEEEQPKEKKKRKSKSAIGSQVTEAKEDTNEIAPEGKVTKSKDKKKSTNASQNGNKEELEKEKLRTQSTQDDIQTANEEVMKKEKKESKKRKRLASGENDNSVDNMVETEKTKENDQVLKVNGSLGSDEPSRKKNRTGENGEARSCDVSEQLNVSDGGNNEKSGDKSSGMKNMKKHHGSAEPTTVKAFQRVKVDDVVFTDERLQDNSYWAKGGAETGYGAKAQEVLGQVRGKDFRHEKTKKKRGSYRGGQIDLQSHSVRFNYSDEE